VTYYVIPSLIRNLFFPVSTVQLTYKETGIYLQSATLVLVKNIQMFKQPCVYIVTNEPRGTLYLGVTSNLVQRTWQHRNHLTKGFTDKYGLTHLVYYELHGNMYEAINREKAMKNWKRMWKIELIESTNPDWVDLYSQII